MANFPGDLNREIQSYRIPADEEPRFVNDSVCPLKLTPARGYYGGNAIYVEGLPTPCDYRLFEQFHRLSGFQFVLEPTPGQFAEFGSYIVSVGELRRGALAWVGKDAPRMDEVAEWLQQALAELRKPPTKA